MAQLFFHVVDYILCASKKCYCYWSKFWYGTRNCKTIDNNNNNNNDSDNSDNKQKEWENKERMFNVDCKGFVAMADVALEFFIKQNHGHLVGISSSAGLTGHANWPEYSGIKACLSTYMQGIRRKLAREGHSVDITDVIPGYIAVEYSPLGSDPQAFWEITTQEAGEIIVNGIKKKQLFFSL